MSDEKVDVSIRHIKQTDLDAVSRMLARAFDDDPVMSFIVKQDSRRSERVRAAMRIALALTLPNEECYVTTDGEGAALWNPPGHATGGFLQNLRLLPTMIQVSGLSGMRRAVRAMGYLEGRHPKTDHYYLMTLGVDPDRQGQGIGGGLIAPVLERSDREGMPAYLENSNERNLPFYERHGFAVRERIELPGSGPSVWLMWREPA